MRIVRGTQLHTAGQVEPKVSFVLYEREFFDMERLRKGDVQTRVASIAPSPCPMYHSQALLKKGRREPPVRKLRHHDKRGGARASIEDRASARLESKLFLTAH